MSRNIKKFTDYFGYIWLLLGTAVVLYFIWSPLFLAEFQSDTAEMLLWAQQIIEKHALISPDFSYSYTIPFGGQLVLIPFVKIFGMRIVSLRAGMSLIAFIFIFVFYCFFRELFGKKYAGLTSGTMTLMLCGVKCMRELFWAHMVFYSLSVFYWMTVMILLKRIIRGELTPGKRKGSLIAVFILCLLGCTTGAPMMIYFAIPLIGTMIIFTFMDPGGTASKKMDNHFIRRTENRVLILILAAVIIGFALSFAFSGDPQDEYSDYYTVLAKADDWAENAGQFITRWIGLFTELNDSPVSLMSPEGIRMSFFIITAVIIAGLDVAAMFLIKRFDPFEIAIVHFHWLLTLILMFFFCFGTISNYERRLIPIFISGVITAFILIRYLLQHSDLIKRANGTILAGLILTASLVDGISVFMIKPDTSLWFADDSIMQILLQNDLRYGYSIDFWFANDITVLTGERTRVREVTINEKGQLVQKKNQTDINWYKDIPEQENYFLICQEWFIDDHPEYYEKAAEVFRSEFIHPVSKKYLGYYILVYNENIVSDQNMGNL